VGLSTTSSTKLTFFLDHQIGSAYAAAKLRGFVVTGKDMSGNELGDLLVRCLDGMFHRTAGRTGPLLFTISRAGSFRKLI